MYEREQAEEARRVAEEEDGLGCGRESVRGDVLVQNEAGCEERHVGSEESESRIDVEGYNALEGGDGELRHSSATDGSWVWLGTRLRARFV